MKVKSILKLTATARFDIVEQVNGEFTRHMVDYLSKSNDVDHITPNLIKYGAQCYLPNEILNSEVKMISTDHATNALVIYLK